MNKKKIIDCFDCSDGVSGFLIRPTGEMMAVIAMHKLSAVIFCVLGIAHAVQYKTGKRRGKQYVS